MLGACFLLAVSQTVFARDILELQVEPEAVLEILPLAADAIDLYSKATAREAAHAAELRKKGIAEVPAESASRYVVDTAGLGEIIFDDRGDLHIDRRFVTEAEMKTVQAIERWIQKWFPRQTEKRHVPHATSGGAGLPVFRGFESARYQVHDLLIARLVAEFNADKANWCGATPAQAEKVSALLGSMVKAHMIEESGGNGPRSVAAWAKDPLQVNVPGDWSPEKELVRLVRPSRRNEGDLETNVRAAIKYLARKGFSSSARPPAERPKSYFDGWKDALRRYNGRRDRTDSDRHYSDEYADKILSRASNPATFVPIEIKLKK
jgi:hypothetical protein